MQLIVIQDCGTHVSSILLHFLRGSGLNGLCGMKYCSGKIIHPLLEFEKKELVEYLLQNGETITGEALPTVQKLPELLNTETRATLLDGVSERLLIAHALDGEITLLTALDAQNGDFILFCADKFQTVCRTLCGLRLEVGDMLGLRDKQDYRFCFVTDFPEFEWSDEEQRYMAMHHPFTMPYEEDLPYLMTDPARVRSQAYDVVLNGIELGSGSIRIHRPDVQALMFRALGFTEETARARFGFMIDAFKYGTPPHGGFAFGLDRLVMQLLGADSLRDVIAFPKVRDASDLMTSAPDFVDAEQLEVLQLGVSTAAEAEKHPQKKRPTMAIKTVAELAKLSLTAEEEVTMGEELNTILGFAEALQEVDTTDVPQTAHVIPTENVLREDIPAAPFDRDLLLSNAPTRTEDCVNVPQTFD